MRKEDYHRFYREGGSAQFDALRLDGNAEIELFAQLLGSRVVPPARLLDVGCGTGRYGAALSLAGFDVAGIDSSPDQLRHCEGLDEALRADATAIPFPDGSFDACILVLMLHQVPREKQAKVLAECGRVLKRDGTLAIKTCSRADLQARPFGRHFPSALPLNERRYPPLEDVESWLRAEGLSETESESTHTFETMPVRSLIDAMSGRHNTTLAMIPGSEVETGMKSLEAELTGHQEVRVDHRHTIIFARRPGRRPHESARSHPTST